MKKFLLSICSLVIIALFSVPAFAATLATPANLSWQEGATATATWDAVDGANYYFVTVDVYYNNAKLGSVETGTSDTAIDLQHEIRCVTSPRLVTTVKAEFSVQAANRKDDGTTEKGSYSVVSGQIDYDVSTIIKLDTPTHLTLDQETLVASWDAVKDPMYYFLDFKIDNAVYRGDILSFSAAEGYTGPILQFDEETGRVSADITEFVKDFYPLYSKSGKDVKLSFRVTAQAGVMGNYISGDPSEWSNAVDYRNDDKPLNTPQNIVFDDETMSLSWDVVEGATAYVGYLKMDGESLGGATDFSLYGDDVTTHTSDGRVTIDLSKNILVKYINKDCNGESVKLTMAVRALCKKDLNSEYNSLMSEFIPEVDFKRELPRYQTPTNLVLDAEKGTLTWENYDSDAQYYSVEIFAEGESGSKTGMVSLGGGTLEGTKMTASVSMALKQAYDLWQLDPVAAAISVRLRAMNSQSAVNWCAVANSDWSEASEQVIYNPNNQVLVESITLAPQNPILAVGNTLIIGKTIQPQNAVYKNIAWSSSDASIATINDFGKITGIKAGDTSITAKIGLVKQTADVHVYEVKTTIADKEEAAAITDQTGDILDDLNNNDAPDLSKIDVDKGKLVETKTVI